MFRPLVKSIASLFFCLAVVGLLVSCAGRKVSTSVQDQTFVPGSSPRAAAPAVEEAKVTPSMRAPAAAMEEARVVEPPITSVTPAPPQPAPELPPAAAPSRVTQLASLADVYFDFDQFLLRKEATAVLEGDARRLKADTGRQVLIEGHCDERGTLAYNLVLGERRARVVKQYLHDLGVPASQLQMTSFGKERPFCAEHSEACWQSNRRAHFAQK